MSEREYQRDLMDVSPQVARKMEPDSVYRILHELGPSLLRDEDFAEMYAEGEGRPSHPPSLMAGILLLQRHADVSDREATERLQFDLRWQHALRLPMDFPEIPHSNLSHFRSRLVIHELEGQVFDRLADMATEAGVVDPGEEQAIDSSHIFGAAAVQDTYELLQDGVRKLLETALEETPEAAEELIESHGLEDRLNTEKPDIDWTSEEERREWLQGIVSDARALLSAIGGHQLAASESVQEAAELLSQILAQDITDPEESDSEESDPGQSDSSEDGPSGSVPSEATAEATGPETEGSEENGVEEGLQIRQGVATDRIISTVDPEMRHGRKSSSTRFDGYKVHITEAVESEFITGVAVSPGNQHDSDVAEDLVEQVRERFGRAPPVLIGDSHYGSPDLRVALKEAFQEREGENQEGENQEVEVVAKLPTATGGSGEKFDKTDFEIDLEEGHVTCPAGHRAETSYQTRDHKDRPVERFQFDGEVCAECPLRSECTSAKNGRSITLHHHEEKVQEVRAYNKTEEFEERYRKRPKVERKLSELLWTHGLRVGRYLGQKKTEMQALLTATVANLKRAGTDLIEKLLPSGSPNGQPTDQMVPATG
ncbi:transposase [Salinibacter ruber]|uniref:IS1182 family transposase n=2 Tax=Salinibacter ruber TaxID=146919 RepID=UPI0021676750|nr:IS1182 family transposase [Salinibacter ruber]MCS4034954.1 transposase [Salinibacter ruber]